VSTVVFPCGCSITRSMFGDCGIMWVLVCFRHSLIDDIHKAQKDLSETTGGFDISMNWEDPDVQEKLVALADAVRSVIS